MENMNFYLKIPMDGIDFLLLNLNVGTHAHFGLIFFYKHDLDQSY